MAELPPSVRGQNRDDFDNEKDEVEEGSKADREKNNNNLDDKKNAAEEGLKTDEEKNDDNDGNDDLWGTGDDGNDDEWAAATSLFHDSDTSVYENNKINPTMFTRYADKYEVHRKWILQTQQCRVDKEIRTVEAMSKGAKKGQVQNIMAVIKAEGMSVKKMLGDGNCLFRSLSDQIYNDSGANHKLVRKRVCNHLSINTESMREFCTEDDVNISEYIEKMKEDKVWGGYPEIAAAAKHYGRTITIFQDGFDNSRYSIGDSIRNEPPLMLLYTGGKHYDSVRGNANFFQPPSSSDEDEGNHNSSLRKYAYDRLPIAKRTRSGPKEIVLTDAQKEIVLTYPFHANENDLSAAASGLKELGGDLLGLDHDPFAALNSSIITTNERKTKQNRTHYITIRVIDMEMLLPGQWLCDNRIDFWMRW
jgi:hypothetical protein